MSIKFTSVQKHKLANAHREASEVLREVKQKKLSVKKLEDMKILEEVVQNLEVLDFR